MRMGTSRSSRRKNTIQLEMAFSNQGVFLGLAYLLIFATIPRINVLVNKIFYSLFLGLILLPVREFIRFS